jgi:TolB-like protein
MKGGVMKSLLLIITFLINNHLSSQNIDDMCSKLILSIKDKKDIKIAVLDFAPINLKNEDAKIIRERITTTIAGYKEVTLVERALLEKILSEIKFQNTGAVDQTQIARIGELSGANYVITGTVSPLKNRKIEINSRIIEVKNANIVSAAKAIIERDWEDISISTKTVSYSKKPITQIAILLDTSNSMDGLIEQAKRQLWSIVNELARYEKNGDDVKIEVALFEYGNNRLPKEDGYIRKISDFTSDMDKISKELFSLTTMGGEEYCGWAIKEAVEKLKWDKRDDVYKAIFIAGNEPFTQGPINYTDAVNLAKSKGIFVNTIFCGPRQQGIAQKWKDAALLSEGEYSNIDQNLTASIETPYDDKIVELNSKLNKTYIPYGIKAKEKMEEKIMMDKSVLGTSKSAMAERVTFAAKAPSYSEWDLISAIESGSISVDKINKDELGDEFKKMSDEEFKKFVSQKLEERKKIREEIKKIEVEREKFIESQKDKTTQNDLGQSVKNIIKKQVIKKGYKKKE